MGERTAALVDGAGRYTLCTHRIAKPRKVHGDEARAFIAILPHPSLTDLYPLESD
jgi:hypothetical protein